MHRRSPESCSPTLSRLSLFGAVTFIAFAAHASRPRELTLRRVVLDLPGPPAVIVAADLNRDGRQDLLIVTAYTRWGSISTDRVEEAVEITEVVPALFDTREARAFLAEPSGRYRPAGPPLALPTFVLSAEAGPETHPVVALTDDGLSEIRLVGSPGQEFLRLEPLLDEPSAFAGTGAILTDLNVLKDVDGDKVLDAVIPTPDGIAVHRGENGGFAAVASFRGRLPGDDRSQTLGRAVRDVPIPRVEDADGDGRADLVVLGLDASPQWIAIARGLGGGRFAPPRTVRLGCLQRSANQPAADAADGDAQPQDSDRRVAWAGDIDGDGRIDVVTREDVDTGKSDMKQAKRPMMRYRLHHLRPDLSVDPKPYTQFDAEGWSFSGGFQDGVDLQFIDLDGDRRKDLVTITLDFSMFQALRALTEKKIGIGLEFHVVAQQSDGSFRLVPDQKLTEKLKLDLNRLEISRLGQFQGDFDGDGRVDFVHLGRGKEVTIHRGQPGGRYAEKPDLSIMLEEEPEDVMLVRVRDFDADGRSDLAITRTLAPPEPGATAPARLELNLSGEPK
jgi:hypothetical protein